MERIGDDTISESLGDEEIPLVEHLSELRRRLVVVLIPFAAVTLLIFPFSNDSLHFLLTNLFHGDMPIFVYSPMEWISVRLTFCFLCALSITIPLLLYEIFAFMRPGLFVYAKVIKFMVNSSSKAEYKGTELMDNRKAHKIMLVLKKQRDKFSYWFWMDDKTGLLLKTQTYQDDEPVMTLEHRNLKINTGIQDSEFEFEIPEGVKVIRKYGQ